MALTKGELTKFRGDRLPDCSHRDDVRPKSSLEEALYARTLRQLVFEVAKAVVFGVSIYHS